MGALEAEVTDWDSASFPLWAKACLVSSAALISASCYIILLLSDKCFKPFAVISSVAIDLDGNALNIVKPLGWVALGLFVAACFISRPFFMWSDAELVRRVDEADVGGGE